MASSSKPPVFSHGDQSFPNRLVISIDFGTTYSAVSYVAIHHSTPNREITMENITSISNYPDSRNFHASEGMNLQVPTEVMYGLTPQPGFKYESPQAKQAARNAPSWTWPSFQWGYSVHQQLSLLATHSKDQTITLKLFKLLLDNSSNTEHVRQELEKSIAILQKHKVITSKWDVITDFFTHLLQHVAFELQRLGFTQGFKKEIVLCIPAIWTQKACRIMQTCLARAMQRSNFGGLATNQSDVGSIDVYIEDLVIVSEPEAAASSTLQRDDTINLGDTFVILDAGGGTIDINTYQVSAMLPMRLEREAVRPDGALHGSSFVNQNFRTYMQTLLEDETYLVSLKLYPSISALVEKLTFDEFEYRLKRRFTHLASAKQMQLGIIGIRDNAQKGIARGSIGISSDKMYQFFHEHLVGIWEALKSQILQAKSSGKVVQKVVAIGGFSDSPCLRDFLIYRIDEFNKEYGSKVYLACFPESCFDAVAGGAIIRALNRNEGPERMIQSSYGLLRCEPYGDYPEHEACEKYHDPIDGETYVQDTILWVLKRGDLVPSVHESERILCIHTFDARSRAPFLCKEELFVTDSVPRSHYPSNHHMNRGAEMIGEITVDFTFLRDEGYIKPVAPVGGQGKRHYRVQYWLVLRVIDRHLECEAIYGDRIKEKCRINIASGFLPGIN